LAFCRPDRGTESDPDRIRPVVCRCGLRRRATITVGAEQHGPGFTADNIGVSFEATDLADPRLDPDDSNLDEQLTSLGSPALRFGGNALDRRTFWTSKGEK